MKFQSFILSAYEIDSWEIWVYQGHSWFVSNTNSGYTNIYGMDRGGVHDLNGKEMSKMLGRSLFWRGKDRVKRQVGGIHWRPLCWCRAAS